jgi:hypothetical protein
MSIYEYLFYGFYGGIFVALLINVIIKGSQK